MSKNKENNLYDLCNPFVESIIDEFGFDLDNPDDLCELSNQINLSCIIYLLSNIQVKILQKYWEKKKGGKLSEEDVINKASKIHPFKLYSYTHNINVEFNWIEKAEIYNDINKILAINKLNMPILFSYNQIELYYALLKKDINFLADYYACLVHVRQRKFLKEIKVDQFIERLISTEKDKNKEKQLIKK